MNKKVLGIVISFFVLITLLIAVIVGLLLTKYVFVDSGKVPDVTFSASIGEINGQIYSARDKSSIGNKEDIPTCKLLPVDVGENNMVGSFCYYDGYVYYTESEGGSSDYSTWLYRCKPDWSQKELLDEVICNWEEAQNSKGAVEYQIGKRDFVIDKGVLYYDEYSSNGETTAINLETKEKYITQMPTYVFTDNNGNSYGSSIDEKCNLVIYNDKVFFTDGDNNLYKLENGNKILLATNAFLDGGCTDEYLYYAEYDYQNSQFVELYRLPLSGGEKELIDQSMPAGGGGPYFCW